MFSSLISGSGKKTTTYYITKIYFTFLIHSSKTKTLIPPYAVNKQLNMIIWYQKCQIFYNGIVTILSVLKSCNEHVVLNSITHHFNINICVYILYSLCVYTWFFLTDTTFKNIIIDKIRKTEISINTGKSYYQKSLIEKHWHRQIMFLQNRVKKHRHRHFTYKKKKKIPVKKNSCSKYIYIYIYTSKWVYI